MREARRLRVGVVGGGYWGSKHVRTLFALDSVDSVVLVEPRPDRISSLMRVFPRLTAFPDLGSALDDVDAVVIATPPSDARAPGAPGARGRQARDGREALAPRGSRTPAPCGPPLPSAG